MPCIARVIANEECYEGADLVGMKVLLQNFKGSLTGGCTHLPMADPERKNYGPCFCTTILVFVIKSWEQWIY